MIQPGNAGRLGNLNLFTLQILSFLNYQRKRDTERVEMSLVVVTSLNFRPAEMFSLSRDFSLK